MKFIPYIFSLKGEIAALQNQSFSSNIIPLINIVEDEKRMNSSISMLDDIEQIIKSKHANTFLINIPMNIKITKKNLKHPIKRFYQKIISNPQYYVSILNRFEKLENVIPTIDVDTSSYSYGDLTNIRSKLSSSKVAYITYATKSNSLIRELSTLISKDDILVYYLDTNLLSDKSIANEITQINILKSKNRCKSIVIKQIFNNMTFYKLPNGQILPNSTADKCIDSNFIVDFSSYNFDYCGDHCGIRNIPIYDGGKSYPAFIALAPSTYTHFGFIGKALDPKSYSTTLLPNILNSKYWKNDLTTNNKNSSYGCSKISYFANLNIKKGQPNPVNNATIWKTITLSHYISIVDFKIKNNLI